jgi:D-amino peptidase
MRIVISADIEGISGLVRDRESGYPKVAIGDVEANPDYLQARKWLTEDINAAVQGAKEAGATAFVVHDSHGAYYRNIDLDELDPAVEYVGGRPIIFYDYDDLDGAGYDAAFMVGMHARAGQKGILSHILDWPLLREVRLNGQPVGESQVTAALAGYYGIPTVLITGDDVICAEIKAWAQGGIETAVVKKSLSRYAGHLLPLWQARQRIRQAASRAVQRIGQTPPSRYETPVRLEVDLLDREIARYISWMPQIAYDGDCTVAYTSDDFLRVYKALCAVLWMATSRINP